VKKALDSIFQELTIDYTHILPFDLIMYRRIVAIPSLPKYTGSRSTVTTVTVRVAPLCLLWQLCHRSAYGKKMSMKNQ